MKLKLPRWSKGDKPKAADLNALSEAIERLANITIEGTYGLQLEETAAGWRLSIAPPIVVCWAVITTQCPAFNTTTNTYGQGVGTIDIETYNSTTKALVRSASSPARSIDVYNSGKDPITVGTRVMVHIKDGHWHTIVEPCP